MGATDPRSIVPSHSQRGPPEAGPGAKPSTSPRSSSAPVLRGPERVPRNLTVTSLNRRRHGPARRGGCKALRSSTLLPNPRPRRFTVEERRGLRRRAAGVPELVRAQANTASLVSTSPRPPQVMPHRSSVAHVREGNAVVLNADEAAHTTHCWHDRSCQRPGWSVVPASIFPAEFCLPPVRLIGVST